MFVLELSKPSSVCVGAWRDGELIGYLICSRYHTVWHLMNIASAKTTAARDRDVADRAPARCRG